MEPSCLPSHSEPPTPPRQLFPPLHPLSTTPHRRRRLPRCSAHTFIRIYSVPLHTLPCPAYPPTTARPRRIYTPSASLPTRQPRRHIQDGGIDEGSLDFQQGAIHDTQHSSHNTVPIAPVLTHANPALATYPASTFASVHYTLSHASSRHALRQSTPRSIMIMIPSITIAAQSLAVFPISTSGFRIDATECIAPTVWAPGVSGL
ncbi:hypothetical protein D9619_008001 [Psilocybe cf. subviscida]|uniref:Uncharacterized protein n=1 Tax=Psilocybe cf. subviscida TaxID=2480587 RepID=A0A8H5ATY3_9AGAR|nr:hypothetical protein D9619_008001 [Psilocybe cf. subviscida]